MECDSGGGELLKEAFEVALHRSSSFCQAVCAEAVTEHMWLVDTDAGWMTPAYVTAHLKCFWVSGRLRKVKSQAPHGRGQRSLH